AACHSAPAPGQTTHTASVSLIRQGVLSFAAYPPGHGFRNVWDSNYGTLYPERLFHEHVSSRRLLD
ncbi:MAG: hypothetical protein V1932_05835, partial [Chloroflexota bacterium]